MGTERVGADEIEACRTCGIYYMISSNYLLPMFTSAPEYSADMDSIRLELNAWDVDLSENDGFPQSICKTCREHFQKLFQFRSCCFRAQQEFHEAYHLREENQANIKIKTELPDEEENVSDFIYIDELSDDEHTGGAAPFNIHHVPIKTEMFEAAVPSETSEEPSCTPEAATNSLSVLTTISDILPNVQNESAQLDLLEQLKEQAIALSTSMVECSLYQHNSPDAEEHNQPMQRINESKDLECHVCGKIFTNSTMSLLKFHLKWHNLNKHVKCPHCGLFCNSRPSLRDHVRAVHAKLRCKICSKMVIGKKMKRHLREHELSKMEEDSTIEAVYMENNTETEEGWEASNDEQVQRLSNELSEQNISHTYSEAYMIENMVYSDNEDVEEMSEDVEQSYELLCAHCDDRFSEKSDLEAHVKEKHVLNKPNAVAAITESSHVDDHTIDVFNESKEYEQDSESFTYDEGVNIEDLAQTMNTFVPIDNNNEDSAYDRFSPDDINHSPTNNDTECSSHIDTETLPFACAKCTEVFATIEQLRVHHKIHTLEQHEQREQSPKSKLEFSCHICGKCFDLKFSLNRHLKKHENLVD